MNIKSVLRKPITYLKEHNFKPTTEGLDFGILPLVMTTSISTIIPLLLFVIVAFVPQGKHILLSNILDKDPFNSSVLIGMYSFLCLFYYQLTKQAYFDKQIRKYKSWDSASYDTKWFNKNYDRIVVIALSPLPLYMWLFYLNFRRGEYDGLHIFSIIISLVLIIILFKGNTLSNSKKRTEDQQHDKDNGVTPYLRLSLYIAFVLVFLYNTYIYEIAKNDSWSSSFTDFLQLKFINQFYLITLIRGAILFLLIYGITQYKKIKGFNFIWYVIVLAICGAFLVAIGSIRSFDVLLLYILMLRFVLFVARKLLTMGFNLIAFPFLITTNSKFINYFLKHNRKIARIIFGILLTAGTAFVFYIFVKGGASDSRALYNFKEVKNRDIDASKTIPLPTLPTFNKYTEDWISRRKNNNDPIYIVAGQGGGSRAGCAFLYSMLSLEKYFDDDLLAMTTISGSSNGAGFYLGLKQHLDAPIKDVNLHEYIVHQLYTKDYISRSLFKMIFSDPLKSWFPKASWGSRNNSLIHQENYALEDLSDSLRLRNVPIKEIDGFLYDTWQKAYEKDTLQKLPVFMPVTYNVSQSRKALSTPYPIECAGDCSFQNVTERKNVNDITIGESISLSEMFPLISASANIDNSSYIDGGAYDNGPFETFHELYKIVSEIRDTIAPNKKIILVSIENSDYDSKEELITTELGAAINAATRTIFTSNPNEHLNLLKTDYTTKGDTLFHLQSYGQIEKDKEIVLSRLLNKYDIDNIICNIQNDQHQFEFNKTKYNLFFDYGKSTISKESKTLLANIHADIMQADSIKLKAFCDKEGDEEHNLYVLKERGKSVKRYLTKIKGQTFSKYIEILDNKHWKGSASFMIERMRDKRVEMYIYKNTE